MCEPNHLTWALLEWWRDLRKSWKKEYTRLTRGPLWVRIRRRK